MMTDGAAEFLIALTQIPPLGKSKFGHFSRPLPPGHSMNVGMFRREGFDLWFAECSCSWRSEDHRRKSRAHSEAGIHLLVAWGEIEHGTNPQGS